MSFNPEKCYVLTVSRKQKSRVNSDYVLHGHTLETVKNATYLGVNLASDLDWGKHIGTITAKGNRTAAFVPRNLKGCTTKVQSHCFKGLVRPVLEYASVVWNPYKENHKNAVDMVQCRAARRICNDYRRTTSTTALVQRLGLESLERRRVTDRACVMYKVMQGLINVKIPPSLDQKRKLTMTLRGHQDKQIQAQPSCDAYKHSFFPDAIRLWNSLSTEAVNAPSIPAFRASLRGWVPPPPV